MGKIDEAIADTAFILDSLRCLREIYESGCCNDCLNETCGVKPHCGQLVRYNCPFYIAKKNGHRVN